MSEPNIICTMRIKNEERWIEQCLREASKLCDLILIIDDGSVDRTPEICRSFSKVRYRYYQRQVDEVRDRRELLQWALENGADWILQLDGDEVLEEGAAETVRQEIARLDPRDPVYTFFYLHILYFWNDPQTYRCEEGIYGDFWMRRLFTTWGQEKEKLVIGATGHGHNLHANGVPINLRGKGRKIDVRVLHYGYLDPEMRQSKYEFYQKHDPEAAARGYYDHLTSEAGMSLAKWSDRGQEQRHSGLFLKPNRYYRAARPEVANLVPPEAKRILDIGCGQGYLGAVLKEQQPQREVVGIELDQMAAAAAREKLDQVLVGNIEQMMLDFPTGYFDCVIMADVLQHLVNPWDTLLYIKKFMAPDGCLVLSVPNVKNFHLLYQLVNDGTWHYQEAGKLDRAHLRFFTLRELQEMLSSLNLSTSEVYSVRDPEVPDLASTVESGKLVLKDLSPADITELQAVQLLVRARLCLPLSKPKGPVSIVIPSCNQLELTKLCLASIERYTTEDYEIIIVDNGSDQATIEYLAAQENVHLICNGKNLGFAAACNQGMTVAKGKYICLLNNDTIVTPGWLSHLAYHLEQNPQALVVGPMSNYASRAQTLPVAFRSIPEIENFAAQNRINNWLKSSQAQTLSGFCLLLKEEVKGIIGGFDTRFWPGNFEDNDYCLRIKLSGHQLLVAHDVYIHHIGSRTFVGESFDYQVTMQQNWQRFREKWGLPENYDPRERDNLAEQLTGPYHREDLFIPLT
ncbi:Methyltransferase type 12 [Desulfotomaculum nigrificans CO-1-SRB]|uniref:Methyltransferase type 12 n=1 Tax=Desulfotomaculum nigrificans (strain DSM 14880 / VKM B-2319 / CO-1-SRB) TaxID=868595 RepID=F6B9I1_DESCC|nr:glycosyltransferase [Desulfotomaculum nigrificans]AEF93757.1 Methyltransferase type 12 [Desulfotomaculum nigrificans CO-1-SRB]